ncbi:MAG: HEPN domain-containing protein [Ignavibacteriales bacterium]|nr:HEPN domain-containing protein [Ignavibacteriales bacterium]
MTQDEHVNYWLAVSEEDWLSAVEIGGKNERKHFALFLGHLSVEKLLKALFVKSFNLTPPYKHDLIMLAVKCNIELSNEQQFDLKIINSFNLEARYPDYKQSFYKKCTFEFVSTELNRIEKVRSWINNLIVNLQ